MNLKIKTPKIIYIEPEDFDGKRFGTAYEKRYNEDQVPYISLELLSGLFDKIECSNDIVKKIQKLLKT